MFLNNFDQDFVAANGESLQIVQEMHKTMTNLFTELIEFYILDANKTNFEEFFGMLYKFILEYTVSTYVV